MRRGKNKSKFYVLMMIFMKMRMRMRMMMMMMRRRMTTTTMKVAKMMMMMTMWSISGSKRWEVRKRTKVFVAFNLFRSTLPLSLWIGQHTEIQKQKCRNTKV